MTKRYLLAIHGKEHQWLFNVEVDPKHIEELRGDGLDINESFNSIPMWIVQAGLMRPWVFFQDVFRFRNPFRL